MTVQLPPEGDRYLGTVGDSSLTALGWEDLHSFGVDIRLRYSWIANSSILQKIYERDKPLNACMYTYCTALLLCPARCYAPTPHFRAKLLYRVVYLNYMAVLPCCYALLAVTPPPHFRAKLLYRVVYLNYMPPPPPRAARAGLRYCSSCTCMRVASIEELYSCIKRVENIVPIIRYRLQHTCSSIILVFWQ